MIDRRDHQRRPDLLARVLTRFAVVAITLGGAGVLAGAITGQSIAIVFVDVLIMIISTLLLLILRARR